ncbi:hypothetical protein CEXT_749571 [Caerostris extrusa]|uniref:Uncharacterized protein n=1 Tax=Caerostris extrusa TaxID=172846 RepID=A0AAV4NP69_CAEEX|nr:hypothetical protein CEXT_749571 [Caerostris extrusa]
MEKSSSLIDCEVLQSTVWNQTGSPRSYNGLNSGTEAIVGEVSQIMYVFPATKEASPPGKGQLAVYRPICHSKRSRERWKL